MFIIYNQYNFFIRTKFSYKISCNLNIITYFENLTVKLHIFYALNIHVKFCVDWILFTIIFTSLYFMHNLKLKKLAI